MFLSCHLKLIATLLCQKKPKQTKPHLSLTWLVNPSSSGAGTSDSAVKCYTFSYMLMLKAKRGSNTGGTKVDP